MNIGLRDSTDYSHTLFIACLWGGAMTLWRGYHCVERRDARQGFNVPNWPSTRSTFLTNSNALNIPCERWGVEEWNGRAIWSITCYRLSVFSFFSTFLTSASPAGSVFFILHAGINTVGYATFEEKKVHTVCILEIKYCYWPCLHAYTDFQWNKSLNWKITVLILLIL